MSDPLSRRSFLQTATAAAAVYCGGEHAFAGQAATNQGQGAGPGGLVSISSGNGLEATAKAIELMQQGADPLDAAIAGVNIVELDPKDNSVGYGGLPNEDGVVELDSSVMHGPSCKGGAVAGLRNIKTPSLVAKLVMERTDHVLLVGEGALRFAKAHGFEEEDLLTEQARESWLRWKEARPGSDWVRPIGMADDAQSSAAGDVWMTADGYLCTYGTIHCSALNAAGNFGAVTTTSGLSYKIPGRVGDSPIIGAGLYVDNAVGSAGATGRGEAVILTGGSVIAVELMRQGKSPTDACLEVLRRIVDRNIDPRLRREDGKPDFDVKMYALRKDGQYGSASIYAGGNFAVHAGGRNRREDCAYLFERSQS
jgi:N4-(beta-N-acetylglucosaminyl)-L-asparaginase